MHVGSLISQVETDVQVLSFGPDLVESVVSSPGPFHPLYLYLFDEFDTPSFSLNTSDIYFVGLNCNQVHNDLVSQSEDENFEYLIHDLFKLRTLPTEEEDSTSREIQDDPLIDMSSLLI